MMQPYSFSASVADNDEDMLRGLDEDMSAFSYIANGIPIPVPSHTDPAKPPMARSMSAPDFVADEWERFMDSKRTDGHKYVPQDGNPSAASSRHVSLSAQQWTPTLSSVPLPFPPHDAYLQQQQQRWCTSTPLPPATSSLTQSLSGQQAALQHNVQPLPLHMPIAQHDPRIVIDSSIRKLKRRGRKLYEELETIAVKLDLLERARAEYGP